MVYGESGLYAIEVKNWERVKPEDSRGPKAFAEDYPSCQRYLLYRGKDRLLLDGVLCIPVKNSCWR